MVKRSIDDEDGGEGTLELMSRASFTVILDGVFEDEGLIDARELAPALLSASGLIQAAHASLNGERAEVRLYVRAGFEKGSFEVGFEVVQGLWNQVRSLFGGDDLKSAKDLLELIGFKVGPGGISVIAFLKWLRGRKPDKVEKVPERPGTTNYYIGNTFVAVRDEVAAMSEDAAVRRALERFVAPVAGREVDSMRIKDGDAVVEIIGEDDLEALAAPEDALEKEREEVLLEGERVAVLEAEKVWFRRGHKWVFTDGTVRYSVEMKDEAFMDGVEKGDHSFRRGDLFHLVLRERAVRAKGLLQTSYTVVNVLKISRRGQEGDEDQGRIF